MADLEKEDEKMITQMIGGGTVSGPNRDELVRAQPMVSVGPQPSYEPDSEETKAKSRLRQAKIRAMNKGAKVDLSE